MLATTLLSLVLGKICPKGQVAVNGICYPESCVFEDAVCNGHGSCIDGECSCDVGFVLTELGCYSEQCGDRHTGYVCGRHGTCTEKSGNYGCECMKGYINLGNDCLSPECMYNNGVCNFMGYCMYDDDDNPYCSCNTVATGDHCENCSDIAVEMDGRCIDRACVSDRGDGVLVECGGFGTCFGLPPDGVETACMCDIGTVSHGLICIPNTCRDGPTDFTTCSNNGYCNEMRQCVCNEGYSGNVCQYKRRDCEDGYVAVDGQCVKEGCISKDGHVCRNKGTCKGEICACKDGHVLIGTAECTPAICLIDGEVCPHGECVTKLGRSYCKCNAEYVEYNNRCIPHSCVSGPPGYGGYPELCSNRGVCDTDARKCICDPIYGGTYCQKCSGTNAITAEDGSCISLNCVEEDKNGNLVACSNRGTCANTGSKTDPNNAVYICACQIGYESISTSTCISPKCMSDDVMYKPCSGHGACVDDQCKCDKGFKGTHCEDYNCPAGETYVLSWGCTPTECVTEYADGKRRLCSGYGRCVKKGNKHTCECRADGQLIDGQCVSSKCLTGADEICHGTGECRDGMCV